MERIFKNLREWRKFKDLSQEELGRELGLGDKWRTYAAWEIGKNMISEPMRQKITGMGYNGPFPEPGVAITAEELQAFGQDLIQRLDHTRDDLKKDILALGAAVQELLKRTGPKK